MDTSKTIGLVRELLMAVSAALITYGIGTDAVWQEVTGGVVALVTLIFAIRANTGREAWFTLIRKVLSAAAGVLVVTGTLEPEKVNALLGVVLSLVAMGWSTFGKGSPAIVPTITLLLACSFMLPSCATNSEPTPAWQTDAKAAIAGAVVTAGTHWVNEQIYGPAVVPSSK
jgi:hypothetical protein